MKVLGQAAFVSGCSKLFRQIGAERVFRGVSGADRCSGIRLKSDDFARLRLGVSHDNRLVVLVNRGQSLAPGPQVDQVLREDIVAVH